MMLLTLSFTDLIEVSSLTEKFQHFSAAVARIYALRGRWCDILLLYSGRYKNTKTKI
jgi:hypothetical protein